MIGDSSNEHSPNNLLLHIYVPDATSTYNIAIKAGFLAVQEPTNKPGDPDIRGMVKDFQGNIWAIGTQIEL